MGLTAPRDEEIVAVVANEFIKLCARNGLSVERICQATIAVAASALKELHGDDRSALDESLRSYEQSLHSAVSIPDEELR